MTYTEQMKEQLGALRLRAGPGVKLTALKVPPALLQHLMEENPGKDINEVLGVKLEPDASLIEH